MFHSFAHETLWLYLKDDVINTNFYEVLPRSVEVQLLSKSKLGNKNCSFKVAFSFDSIEKEKSANLVFCYSKTLATICLSAPYVKAQRYIAL